MVKLSDAQKRFLLDMTREGFSSPPYGYRGAGPDASRWHRTADILHRLGYVKKIRVTGGGVFGIAMGYGCYYTFKGLAETVMLSKESK